MEGRVSARKTELPVPPPRNLMALKSVHPGGIVEFLPLLLLGKQVMRGHERGWRQFAWKFRSHEEDLERSVGFQGCGGLEVLIPERWMWLGVWIVPASISLNRLASVHGRKAETIVVGLFTKHSAHYSVENLSSLNSAVYEYHLGGL